MSGAIRFATVLSWSSGAPPAAKVMKRTPFTPGLVHALESLRR